MLTCSWHQHHGGQNVEECQHALLKSPVTNFLRQTWRPDEVSDNFSSNFNMKK